MADSDEVCGCNGVTKGTICKAIKDKGLFTLDEVRKHTKASASCGSCTGLVEQLLMFTAGGDYSPAPKKKAMCGCTDASHQEARDAIRQAAPADHRQVYKRAGLAHAQRLRQLPPGDQLLPDQHLAQGGAGRPAEPLHQRAQPRQHPEGRHLQRDPAHVGRRDHGRRAAPHRRRGGQVQDPHRQGHRRPAHRPAGREEGRPARVWQDIGMPSGHAYAKALRTVKTCVGSEWCRFGTQDSTQMGKDLERALWRMYAPHKVKLAVSGCPRNCAEAGIKDVGVIGVDSGWEIYVAGNGGIKTEVAQFLVQAEDGRRGAGVQRRLPAALPRGRLVPGAHRALRRPRRAGPREEEDPRRPRRPQGAVGAAAVQRSTASPTPGSSSSKAQVDLRQFTPVRRR
jgi:nitrite reductase (NADH) large subunit